jgi:hypothetical protein
VSDQSDTPVTDRQVAMPGATPTAPAPLPPPSTPASTGPPAAAGEHPELPVGAAFAGGLALALILKRLAR